MAYKIRSEWALSGRRWGRVGWGVDFWEEKQVMAEMAKKAAAEGDFADLAAGSTGLGEGKEGQRWQTDVHDGRSQTGAGHLALDAETQGLTGSPRGRRAGRI